MKWLFLILLSMVLMMNLSTQPADEASPEWPRDEQGNYLVTFRFTPSVASEQIFLAGEMNEWNPRGTEMSDPDRDGTFEVTVPLAAGRHLYKFTINGMEWRADPQNSNTDGSGFGNSVLYLGVNPQDYPEDQESAPPPPPPVWLPSAEQTGPTPRENPTHTFRLASGEFDEVYVSGDFNDWTGQLDQLEFDTDSGEWILALALEEPIWTRYRFVVRRGDEWDSVRDPANPRISFDGHPVDSVVATAGADHGVVEIMTPLLTASSSTLEARPIYVWLPPQALADPEERFPVLTMHDGQNAFDDPVNPFGHGGWHVNTIAEQLIAEGRIRPFIVVAVPNSENRLREYLPDDDMSGDSAYARYLIEDVMPLVNQRYPTLEGPEHTAVMGSSMGGVVSLYLVYTHPDVFGSAACLSGAYHVTGGQERSLIDLVRNEGKRPVRVYIDSGNAGESQDGAPSTRELRDAMTTAGWVSDEDFVWHEEDGALHSETAWRERLWRPLEFLFGTE